MAAPGHQQLSIVSPPDRLECQVKQPLILFLVGGWTRPEGDVELLLRAAAVSLLNRRALDVAVGTIHTTIALLRLYQSTAALTFVEELARISGHQFSNRAVQAKPRLLTDH